MRATTTAGAAGGRGSRGVVWRGAAPKGVKRLQPRRATGRPTGCLVFGRRLSRFRPVQRRRDPWTRLRGAAMATGGAEAGQAVSSAAGEGTEQPPSSTSSEDAGTGGDQPSGATEPPSTSHEEALLALEGRLSEQGFGPSQALLLLLTSLVTFTSGLEIYLLSLIGLDMQCDWHISPAQAASLFTVVFMVSSCLEPQGFSLPLLRGALRGTSCDIIGGGQGQTRSGKRPGMFASTPSDTRAPVEHQPPGPARLTPLRCSSPSCRRGAGKVRRGANMGFCFGCVWSAACHPSPVSRHCSSCCHLCVVPLLLVVCCSSVPVWICSPSGQHRYCMALGAPGTEAPRDTGEQPFETCVPAALPLFFPLLLWVDRITEIREGSSTAWTSSLSSLSCNSRINSCLAFTAIVGVPFAFLLTSLSCVAGLCTWCVLGVCEHVLCPCRRFAAGAQRLADSCDIGCSPSSHQRRGCAGDARISAVACEHWAARESQR